MTFFCGLTYHCAYNIRLQINKTPCFFAEPTMNKVNITLFLAALLVIGACAEPRKLLASSEGAHLADAAEHQRILAELEEVHQLRERMLQEGKISLNGGSSRPQAPLCIGRKLVLSVL